MGLFATRQFFFRHVEHAAHRVGKTAGRVWAFVVFGFTRHHPKV
jgi:hypothetical protein